jgi:hypothetical protein
MSCWLAVKQCLPFRESESFQNEGDAMSMQRMNRVMLLSVSLAIVLAGPTCSCAGSFFIDDFEDGDATDGDPVTWVPGLAPDAATREVIAGDYVLSSNVTSSSLVQEYSDLGDVSVLTKLRITELGGSVAIAGVLARRSENASYFGGIWPDGRLRVGETDSSLGFVQWHDEQTALDPLGSDILLNLEVRGSEISLTGWEDGHPRPETPQVSFTDDSLSQGGVGLFLDTGDPSTVAFRFFANVPEPSAFLLTLLALGVVGGWRKWGV